MIQLERDGEIAVLTIANPPVNAISQPLRQQLLAHLADIKNSDNKALVILGAGRCFVAGADINEFDRAPQPPHLPDVLDELEAMPIPVVAAMHGAALGGGLELAMACHYRLAVEGTQLGLPEVNLGIIPGAGGVLRAPRIMGLSQAFQFIAEGKAIDAKRGREWGLIDMVADADLRVSAVGIARSLVAEGKVPRRSSELPVAAADDEAVSLGSLSPKVAKAVAPLGLLELFHSVVEKPYDQARDVVREKFLQLKTSTRARALRYLFLAEKSAGKFSAGEAEPVGHIAIVGAGTMGSGIAIRFLEAGLAITLIDNDAQALLRGQQHIHQFYERAVAKGRCRTEHAQQCLARLHTSTQLASVADAPLVIEAVFESVEVKQALFDALAAHTSAQTIVASNTSYQDVHALAQRYPYPNRVIGMHFFSPANVMPLLEVVDIGCCDRSALATAFQLARRAGMKPVLARQSYGFIGNRMFLSYSRQAQQLLLEGASVEQVDEAMEQWGMAMGPLAVADLAGLDIGYRARQCRSDKPEDPTYFRLGDILVENDRLGQKTSAGFYDYNDKQRSPSEWVRQRSEQEGRALGVSPGAFDTEGIRERLLLAVINEAFHILHEGVANSAADIDVVFVNGYGFPRHEGGPLAYAERMGLDRVLEKVEALAAVAAQQWPVSPLLRQLVVANQGLSDWAAQRANNGGSV